MSERDRTIRDASPDRGGEDEMETRLRALCVGADLPLGPSESLRRRVAVAAVEPDARARRKEDGRLFRSFGGRRMIAAGAAAALLVVCGVLLLRQSWNRSVGSGNPTVVQTPPRQPGATERRQEPRVPLGGPVRKLMVRAPVRAPHPSGTDRANPMVTPTSVRAERNAEEPADAASRRQPSGATSVPTVGDDLEDLNGDPMAAIQRWAPLSEDNWARIEGEVRRTVRVRDDFVHIPFPRLADASGGMIARAVASYKREAAIVDPRLSQEVTLQLKGIALADLCDRLRQETGIRVEAGRSVADEKVTIFCRKMRLRDVMRSLSRPFGYTWLRSGSDGDYRYELTQDLRAQLLEEERRNQDVHAALVALDARMQAYRPYLGVSLEALGNAFHPNPETKSPLWELVQKRIKQHPETRKLLGDVLFIGAWGGMQLYHRLGSADRSALMAGQELVFRPGDADPDRRLPAEWVRPILQSFETNAVVNGKPTLMADVPGMQITQVRLWLNRSELGQASLLVRTTLKWNGDHGESWTGADAELARGGSPSVTKPENAAANAAQRGRSPFDRVVSLRPEPSCPALRRVRSSLLHGGPTGGGIQGPSPRSSDAESQDSGARSQPHVFASDVWEAVHRASGLPIIADCYTRIYPLGKATVQGKPLFDALCTVADALGYRWAKEGEFLICRSASFFWDKLKEVPNRRLKEWARSRDANGGLPFVDFLEMAALSDRQLDSAIGSEAITHCWGLRERDFLTSPGRRWQARFLATLSPQQLKRALEPDGLPFGELTPSQQQDALRMQNQFLILMERQGRGEPTPFPLEYYKNAFVTAQYVPAGWWFASPARPDQAPTGVLANISGRTREDALAAARKLGAEVAPEHLQRSENGHFSGGIMFVFRKAGR